MWRTTRLVLRQSNGIFRKNRDSSRNQVKTLATLEQYPKMRNFEYKISIPGYTMKLAKPEDFKEVHEFVHNSFNKQETMFKSLYARTVVSEEYDKLIEKDCEHLLTTAFDNSPCLIIIHEPSQKIVGVNVMTISYNPMKKSKVNAHVSDLDTFRTTFMKNYLRYFDEMIERADFYGRFPDAYSGIEFYAVAVATEHQRLGLSRDLFYAGISLAKTLPDVGFIYGICTSEYSRRSAEKCGIKHVLDVDILNYKDEQGRPMFQDTPPHNIVSIMALKI